MLLAGISAIFTDEMAYILLSVMTEYFPNVIVMNCSGEAIFCYIKKQSFPNQIASLPLIIDDMKNFLNAHLETKIKFS